METDASQVLIIFTKNARLGAVKQRLASTVGDEQAFKIYLALLERTRQIAQAVPVQRQVYYSDFVAVDDEWPAAHFSKKIQRGKDLGERMANALQEVLSQFQKAVLIGSDIPGLSAEILTQAFVKLKEYDLVLGPASDGGYYLIGMKTPCLAIFQNIAWGTSAVLEQTLEAALRTCKTCFLLPILSDVDTEEDWQRHGWKI